MAEVQNDERFNPVCYSFLIVSGFVASGRLTSPCSRNNLCGHKKNPPKTLSFRRFESCGLPVNAQAPAGAADHEAAARVAVSLVLTSGFSVILCLVVYHLYFH